MSKKSTTRAWNHIPIIEVARRTMRGFGGLVTFLVKDADWRATADVVDAVQIPRIGPSLGGVESLIEQPLVMSYYEATPEDRQRLGIPDNMIRVCVRHREHRGPDRRFPPSAGAVNLRLRTAVLSSIETVDSETS